MNGLDSRPSSSSTTLLLVAAGLLGIGVVMVFSAGARLTAPTITENPLRNPAVRHAAFSLVALVVLLMVGLCPYQSWRIRSGTSFQPSVWLLAGTITLLAVVLIPGIGQASHGARRWLSLGPVGLGLGFQPSELAKPALIVFLAGAAAHLGGRLRRFWSGFLPVFCILLLVVGLVGVEDFGTAALLMLVGGCVLLGAGARVWHLGLACLPAAVGFVTLILMRPFRMQRLLTFVDPYADPTGSGYHQIQSLITIASGGWWGRGLGAGIQKYGYLPEGRSDFIFAVICEEIGLVGGLAVIALFAILVWQGRRAMLAAPTEFGRLLALGATFTIGTQAAMNIAVVTVSVPTKGIGLPLVSAGGSSVVFFGILVGILINVARERPKTALAATRQPTADINLRPQDRQTGRGDATAKRFA